MAGGQNFEWWKLELERGWKEESFKSYTEDSEDSRQALVSMPTPRNHNMRNHQQCCFVYWTWNYSSLWNRNAMSGSDRACRVARTEFTLRLSGLRSGLLSRSRPVYAPLLCDVWR
eukprot:2955919-Rhodomonas_salina.1